MRREIRRGEVVSIKVPAAEDAYAYAAPGGGIGLFPTDRSMHLIAGIFTRPDCGQTGGGFHQRELLGATLQF